MKKKLASSLAHILNDKLSSPPPKKRKQHFRHLKIKFTSLITAAVTVIASVSFSSINASATYIKNRIEGYYAGEEQYTYETEVKRLIDIAPDCGRYEIYSLRYNCGTSSFAWNCKYICSTSDFYDSGCNAYQGVVYVDDRITGSYQIYYNQPNIQLHAPIAANSYKNIYGDGSAMELIYTPSASDLAKGVCLVQVCPGNTYISKSYSETFSATKIIGSFDKSIIGSHGGAYLLCLRDIIEYVDTGIYTPLTVDPTSSFSSTSATKKYGDLAFSAGFTTDSDGTLSYSSSNTSVATISSSGSITITGIGSTTITASTAKTSSYYADSKTMTLTVSKGTISVSTNPSASSIQYGQTLSSSTITGGSTKNQAGNSVTGTWLWKSPTTVPNAGTTAFTVIFTPSDTTNYNY